MQMKMQLQKVKNLITVLCFVLIAGLVTQTAFLPANTLSGIGTVANIPVAELNQSASFNEIEEQSIQLYVLYPVSTSHYPYPLHQLQAISQLNYHSTPDKKPPDPPPEC